MSNKSLHFRDFIYNEDIKKYFHPLFVQDYTFVEECLLPVRYKKYAEDILNFEVKEDDIFVSSFPKCGTTWAQEMVWCIGNDLDFEKAKEPLQKRFPFLEMSSVVHVPIPAAETDTVINKPDLPDYFINSLEYTKALLGQRYIKTHLPLQLLPRQLQKPQSKAKMVYVARDPRDACISYFHHYRLMHGYIGDLSSFVRLFLNDGVKWAPFWQHILGYWNIRHESNMLFITYEDMKRDLPAVIQRVADFLAKPLTQEKVEDLASHLSFENMKSNQSVNHDNIADKLKKISGCDGKFMRLGKSGVFMKDLTEDEINLLNSWCKKNLGGTDYILPEYV